jgi:peptidoglycan/LPS O-acetylase OafA/YrhL
MSDKEKRIPSLDGLRAISIIFVIFAHTAGGMNLPEWVGRLELSLGPFGVRIFFAISGFLITSLLLYEKNKRGEISLSAFYKRRALRILPVYYFYILTVLVLDRFVGPTSIAPSSFFGAATFTTRLWGDWRHNDFPSSDWPLFHTWSLSVEEQFYLLWPIVLCLLTSRHKTYNRFSDNILWGGVSWLSQ